MNLVVSQGLPEVTAREKEPEKVPLVNLTEVVAIMRRTDNNMRTCGENHHHRLKHTQLLARKLPVTYTLFAHPKTCNVSLLSYCNLSVTSTNNYSSRNMHVLGLLFLCAILHRKNPKTFLSSPLPDYH